MSDASPSPSQNYRVLRSEPWDFELFVDSSGKHFLNVLCGGIGVFDVCIALTNDELERYQEWGDFFIQKLAREIQSSPQTFASRAAQISPNT